MEKVFVYGTLKTGYHNNHLLNGFTPTPAIAHHIDLHRGPGFPFATRGTGTAVGEVYHIDKLTLQRLDRLEGHPAFYKREKTKVFCEGEFDEVWIYLYPDADKYPIIECGEWK